MIYIEVSEDPATYCVKGTMENLKGQVNHYAFMNREGTWPFLHHRSLYRGIGLVSALLHCEHLHIVCNFGYMISNHLVLHIRFS